MTEFYVKVEPNSETFKLEQNSIIRAKLESKAEKNRANAELVTKLQEILGEKLGIVSGHKSRRKKLRVDLPEKEFGEKLEEHIHG